jgi:hypothetical protein
MQFRASAIALLTVLLALISGCASQTNFVRASCRMNLTNYEITLTGTRPSRSHSLIRAVVDPTQEESQTFQVPRISGSVDGSEIPTPHGFYKYGGTIEFQGPQLLVNLHYINTDQNLQDPLSWNGAYQLDACSATP